MRDLTEIEQKRATAAWIIAGVSLLTAFVLFFFGTLEDHFAITFSVIVFTLYSSNIVCWFLAIGNYSKITAFLKISIIVLNIIYFVAVLMIIDFIKVDLPYNVQFLSKIFLSVSVLAVEIWLFIEAVKRKKSALAAPALFHTIGLLFIRGFCDFMIFALNGI